VFNNDNDDTINKEKLIEIYEKNYELFIIEDDVNFTINKIYNYDDLKKMFNNVKFTLTKPLYYDYDNKYYFPPTNQFEYKKDNDTYDFAENNNFKDFFDQNFKDKQENNPYNSIICILASIMSEITEDVVKSNVSLLVPSQPANKQTNKPANKPNNEQSPQITIAQITDFIQNTIKQTMTFKIKYLNYYIHNIYYKNNKLNINYLTDNLKPLLQEDNLKYALNKCICKKRLIEGEFINESLNELRNDLNTIIKIKSENMVDYMPYIYGDCFEKYCDLSEKNCFVEKGEQSLNTNNDNTTTITSPILKFIFEKIKPDSNDEIEITIANIYKNVKLCIFGVFDVTVSSNNPPSVKYIDINELKSLFYNTYFFTKDKLQKIEKLCIDANIQYVKNTNTQTDNKLDNILKGIEDIYTKIFSDITTTAVDNQISNKQVVQHTNLPLKIKFVESFRNELNKVNLPQLIDVLNTHIITPSSDNANDISPETISGETQNITTKIKDFKNELDQIKEIINLIDDAKKMFSSPIFTINMENNCKLRRLGDFEICDIPETLFLLSQNDNLLFNKNIFPSNMLKEKNEIKQNNYNKLNNFFKNIEKYYDVNNSNKKPMLNYVFNILELSINERVGKFRRQEIFLFLHLKYNLNMANDNLFFKDIITIFKNIKDIKEFVYMFYLFFIMGFFDHFVDKTYFEKYYENSKNIDEHTIENVFILPKPNTQIRQTQQIRQLQQIQQTEQFSIFKKIINTSIPEIQVLIQTKKEHITQLQIKQTNDTKIKIFKNAMEYFKYFLEKTTENKTTTDTNTTLQQPTVYLTYENIIRNKNNDRLISDEYANSFNHSIHVTNEEMKPIYRQIDTFITKIDNYNSSNVIGTLDYIDNFAKLNKVRNNCYGIQPPNDDKKNIVYQKENFNILS
jgi:hypothetical protein